MNSSKVRVLIVDDTVFYRTVLRKVLDEIPGVEVVGTATNGKIALTKLDKLKPDLITLDQEMPEMDGLETLRHLRDTAPDITTIMISSHTTLGAQITLKALELGAFDFIAKAKSNNYKENFENLQKQFRPVLNAAISKLGRRSNGNLKIPPLHSYLQAAPDQSDSVIARMGKIAGSFRPEIIAIGVSTGGPNALAKVIPKLPAKLNTPVVVVQHMPPVFTGALADSLDSKSALTVVEAKTGQLVEAGKVYIAPGGKHMKLVAHTEDKKHGITITDDPPENHCRPSVDYLFRSVAELYKNRALGIIMTGMGRDGTTGLQLMKRAGAKVIAQDEQSCVVFGMPMEAIKCGIVDMVLPLDQIAAKVTGIVKGM